MIGKTLPLLIILLFVGCSSFNNFKNKIVFSESYKLRIEKDKFILMKNYDGKQETSFQSKEDWCLNKKIPPNYDCWDFVFDYSADKSRICKQEEERLHQVVFEGIGEALMCWSETPKGVFESTKAEEVGNKILAVIAKNYRRVSDDK